MKIEKVEISDFDDTTVSVTVCTYDVAETFHVQTHDGKHDRPSGCWIFDQDGNGEDILHDDDYFHIDFNEVIELAEEYLKL